MLGTPSAGFAGNAGTEQVAQIPLLLERIPPRATAQGNASRSHSSAPCSPCPSLPSPGWPIFTAGAAPFHRACRKRTDTRGTHRTDRHSDTGTCTGTHGAHTGTAPCLLDSHAPRAWSPWLSALGYGRQQEHCQQLVGPSGRWQPRQRRAVTLESHSRVSARGGQHRQHLLLQGYLWVSATLRRSQSAHLPTSLNQGKRS